MPATLPALRSRGHSGARTHVGHSAHLRISAHARAARMHRLCARCGRACRARVAAALGVGATPAAGELGPRAVSEAARSARAIKQKQGRRSFAVARALLRLLGVYAMRCACMRCAHVCCTRLSRRVRCAGTAWRGRRTRCSTRCP